jgi:hypothetical protein
MSSVTTLVSVNRSNTYRGNDMSNAPIISADGRRVLFWSVATDLVNGFDNYSRGYAHVFVRDLPAQTTSLVSVNSRGTTPVGTITYGNTYCMSTNGVVAFTSVSPQVVRVTDTNNMEDVFFRRLAP